MVAISPSRPCNSCKYCSQGIHTQCLNMRFYGSAMPFPHIQGAFREKLIANPSQCVLANGILLVKQLWLNLCLYVCMLHLKQKICLAKSFNNWLWTNWNIMHFNSKKCWSLTHYRDGYSR